MVTASCRIGYDFSTPDGPLTMKLAETPSRSAGLIISVFGVPSSPIDAPRNTAAAARARKSAKRTGERRFGQGSRALTAAARFGRTRRLLPALVHLLRIGAGLRLALRRGRLLRVLRLRCRTRHGGLQFRQI